jgi:hypothetical protein
MGLASPIICLVFVHFEWAVALQYAGLFRAVVYQPLLYAFWAQQLYEAFGYISRFNFKPFIENVIKMSFVINRNHASATCETGITYNDGRKQKNNYKFCCNSLEIDTATRPLVVCAKCNKSGDNHIWAIRCIFEGFAVLQCGGLRVSVFSYTYHKFWIYPTLWTLGGPREQN